MRSSTHRIRPFSLYKKYLIWIPATFFTYVVTDAYVPSYFRANHQSATFTGQTSFQFFERLGQRRHSPAIYRRSGMFSRIELAETPDAIAECTTWTATARRDFFHNAFVAVSAAALISSASPALADADLSGLYDEDGRPLDSSLTSSTVSIAVPFTSAGTISHYDIPSRWKMPGYIDVSLDGSEETFVACDGMEVFVSSSGNNAELVKRLEKAGKIGVAVALGLEGAYKDADVVGAKKRKGEEDGMTYYDFDLAIAPKNCAERDPNNLGLGFCPYESIALLSAVAFSNQMYIFRTVCGPAQWKRSNSDLKKSRQSFRVEADDNASNAAISQEDSLEQ
eukprot:CAMPEP_0113313824 /NCGR_PEP_ID=MMETSP0010_2-20120614/10101_1 /TAXON_ID=216773 ORGANISM="Corethron hystrix, Strain 308" /NCGR_SAMPLE_ID=MMETSP0010_2 /ASSEMBLY_ACC=CAM_ASM_000155 /LENGTH=336 /DNA_ID=CAMNT_0000169929 /DNA_START=83 /DNA_END=1093 /DNA_ORIENTATION=+ /assembly_acc=CAM_ASM_000155